MLYTYIYTNLCVYSFSKTCNLLANNEIRKEIYIEGEKSNVWFLKTDIEGYWKRVGIEGHERKWVL